MTKILFVLDSPNESFSRLIDKAAKVAGLQGYEITSIAGEDLGGAWHHEKAYKARFYETIEEPIYTKTGKVSKKTKKITRETSKLRDRKHQLIQELERKRPTVIVAMGNEVLQTLTGFVGVSNYRGSILGCNNDLNLKVLATEHPSLCLRGGTLDFWILAQDLRKAKREGEFPEVRREPFESHSDPKHSLQHILGCLEHLRWTNPLWTLDVETRAGTLACFAISFRDTSYDGDKLVSNTPIAFSVPIQTTSGPYWEPEEELEIWRALRDAANANPNLCNQNIEYDLYYLQRYGVEPAGVWMDTMLAHSILYPEMPKSLDFLASWYLDDIVYWKQDHREWSGRTPDEALWQYNCKDAVYTLRIVEKIDVELKRRGMWEMYHGRPKEVLIGL